MPSYWLVPFRVELRGDFYIGNHLILRIYWGSQYVCFLWIRYGHFVRWNQNEVTYSYIQKDHLDKVNRSQKLETFCVISQKRDDLPH